MNAAILVWALWIDAGGHVNSGDLSQPYVAAYFETAEECQRVNALIRKNRLDTRAHWSQCVQAKYIIPTK